MDEIWHAMFFSYVATKLSGYCFGIFNLKFYLQMRTTPPTHPSIHGDVHYWFFHFPSDFCGVVVVSCSLTAPKAYVQKSTRVLVITSLHYAKDVGFLMYTS